MMHKNKVAKLISEELNNPERIERKHIDMICEACTKIIAQCSKKDLKLIDLKWQPHYSTVFKQLKTQLESILSTDSSKSLDKLNTIPYLLALKNETFVLLNSFSKFVLENGCLIGTKDSNQRKNFFIKVVHFQFLCHEIQAYFPAGVYSPSKFKISKNPARSWWEKMFGEITFVDLDTFVNKFKEDYQFVNQAEIFSFKNSINFTSTNFTTTFEFDLFTRLYSPWEIIQQAWRIIYNHPGYLHFSTYGDTKDILSHYLNKPGTYVFRVSCKDLGYWTIGYVKGSKDMGQIKVDKTNLIEALVEGKKKNMYLYPNGELCNPDLSNLSEFRKEILVKNDEIQLYACFEDYKECKICRESEKDLQLESCGHQICHSCFKMMRKYDKKLCPFCNQKILSTTKIVNIQNKSVPSSIYVDPNPAQSIDEAINDSTYAHMTSDNKEVVTATLVGNGSVQARINTFNRNNDHGNYSNMSDDGSPNGFSSLPLPDAPARPPRDKPVYLPYAPAKSEINYPPMQQQKNNDGPLKKPSNVPVPFKSNPSPPSPMYTEMSSTMNVTAVKVDELYSDVTDHDPSDQAITAGSNHTFLDDTYLTPNDVMSHKAPLEDTYLTPRKGRSYKPLVDDTYLTPNELVDHNQSHDDTYMTPREVRSHKPIVDDTYMTPREVCSHKPIVDDTYMTPREVRSHKPMVDDTYLTPNELMSHPQYHDDTYLTPNEVISQSRNNEDRDDIYYDPITSPEQNCDDDGVYMTPAFSQSTQATNPASSKPNTSNIVVPEPSEEMYSSFHEVEESPVSAAVVRDRFFDGWSEADISRALRVARNDREMARDILMEFVDTH